MATASDLCPTDSRIWRHHHHHHHHHHQHQHQHQHHQHHHQPTQPLDLHVSSRKAQTKFQKFLSQSIRSHWPLQGLQTAFHGFIVAFHALEKQDLLMMKWKPGVKWKPWVKWKLGVPGKTKKKHPLMEGSFWLNLGFQ